jgi:hypothetical protein
MSRFHLYRHYDANGDLLYVGQSNNAFERYREHRYVDGWTLSAVVMKIESFDSLDEVIAAERKAIRTENPRHNQCHVARTREKRPDDRLLQMRVDDEFIAIVDEWRAAQRPIPSRTEAIRRLVELGVSAKGGGKK